MEAGVPGSVFVGDQCGQCPLKVILPALSNFYNGSGSALVQWKTLARELDTNEAQIQFLEAEYPRNRPDLLERVLKDWTSRKPQKATLGQLIIVLRKLEWNSAADNIMLNWNQELTRRQVIEELTDQEQNSQQPFSTEPLLSSQTDVPNIGFCCTLFSGKYINKRRCIYVTLSVIIVGIIVIGIISYLQFSSTADWFPKCKRSNDFSKQKIHVSSYDQYVETKTKTSACINDLTISFDSPTAWKTNAPIYDAEVVEVLTFKEHFSVDTLQYILHQTHNIVELHIGECIHSTHSGSTNYKLPTPQPPMLLYLQTITFSNYSNCKHIINYVSNLAVSSKYYDVSFVKGEITEDNFESMKVLINRFKINLLVIEGSLMTMNNVFHSLSPMHHVNHLILNLKLPAKDKTRVKLLIDRTFCKKFPVLKGFQSTVGISYIELINLLKECVLLQSVNVTTVVKDNEELYDIAQIGRSKVFMNSFLYFIFFTDCPGREVITLWGLAEFKKTVCRNCVIWSDECTLFA